MRTRWFLTLALFATLSLDGCVVVLSHAYSDVGVNSRSPISESDSTWGVLRLAEPMVENLVIDLTHKIEGRCGGGRLENVQTKLVLREFILFQVYSVRLTAQCAGPVSERNPANGNGRFEVAG